MATRTRAHTHARTHARPPETARHPENHRHCLVCITACLDVCIPGCLLSLAHSVSQCYTRPSMDDGAHALVEHRALHTRRCVRSQGKASPQTKEFLKYKPLSQHTTNNRQKNSQRGSSGDPHSRPRERLQRDVHRCIYGIWGRHRAAMNRASPPPYRVAWVRAPSPTQVGRGALKREGRGARAWRRNYYWYIINYVSTVTLRSYSRSKRMLTPPSRRSHTSLPSTHPVS